MNQKLKIIIGIGLIIIILYMFLSKTSEREYFTGGISAQRQNAADVAATRVNNLSKMIQPLNNTLYNPLDDRSQERAAAEMSSVIAVPTLRNYGSGAGISKNAFETLPTNLSGTPFATVKKCEAVRGDSCSAFGNKEFAENCGICVDETGKTSNGDMRVGGLFFSQEHRSLMTDEKKAAPTVGSCPIGKFVVSSERCERLKKEKACVKAQSFSIEGCSQCLDTGKFSYVDIEDTGIIFPRLNVIGKGILILSNTPDRKIKLSDKPQVIELTNLLEGDYLILNISGRRSGYIAGYISGDTKRGEYRQDIYRLIDVDAVSGRKPTISGNITVGKERCMKIVGRSVQTEGNDILNMLSNNAERLLLSLRLYLAYSFLGTESEDGSQCPTSPYITKQGSANYLSSSPCYKKGNEEGSYSVECLQHLWGQSGCTGEGSQYPADTSRAAELNKKGSIQSVAEYIYELSVKSATGSDTAGRKLSHAEYADAAKKCTGRELNNICDMQTPGQPISKDCMKFLYDNTGAGTHTGATYSTNEANVCSENGDLNPMKVARVDKPVTIFTRLPDSPTTHGKFDIKKNYKITFTLRQTGYVSNWGCLFHFNMTGNDCCNVGDRMPAMWFEPGSNKFHIPIGDVNEGNWYLSPPHQITLNKDTPIEIIANGQNILIKIDGIEYNYRQPNRRPTGVATLHAPDPWYSRFQGELRDFTFFTSDSPITGLDNKYKITDNMNINQIKGVYNTAYSDMMSRGPNAAAGLAACKGIS